MLTSKYQLATFDFRSRTLPRARSLKVMGATPGGQARHFCVPL